MKKIIQTILTTPLLLVTLLSGESAQSAKPWEVSSKPYPAYQTSIPQVVYTQKFRHINLPEFWISQIRYPDKKVMTLAQIKHLNIQTAKRKELIFPPQDFSTTYSGDWVRGKLDKLHTFLSEKAFYFENGKRIGNQWFKKLQTKSNLDAIPDTITTRYALVVNYANHRISPTDQTLLKKPQQLYFDRNQNAALDIGTALAILHQSRDKKWYFALSPSSYGWIAAEDIAQTTQKKMLDYTQSKNFAVTINPKNALWIDHHYDDFVRMGVRLPYLGKLGDYAQVQIPKRNSEGSLQLRTATIRNSDIHLGYLTYTPRIILTQAFKFLNAPYGWGGMFGEQDCSKFLQEIYATVGLKLPRNSGEQEKTGKALIDFEGGREKRIDTLIVKGTPASTLLYLPGHIMLYLGSYEGVPYMIHTVWGAIQGQNPIAKTAVTSVNFKAYIEKMDRASSLTP